MPKQWFVQRKNSLYGPFSLEKMKKFISENRVRPHSKVCKGREYPLEPAKNDPDLAGFFPEIPLVRETQSPQKKNQTSQMEKRVSPSSAHVPQQKSSRSNKQEIKGHSPVNSSQTQPAGKREAPSPDPVRKPTKTKPAPQEKRTSPEQNSRQRSPQPKNTPGKPAGSSPRTQPRNARIQEPSGHKNKPVSKKEKPAKKKAAPFLIFILLVAVFGAGTLWIIQSKNPAKKKIIEKLEQTSKVRTMLKTPPLPLVWDLWKQEIVHGLNFSADDIRQFHSEGIPQKINVQTLALPRNLTAKSKDQLTYIEKGGYFHTYLLDETGFVFAIVITHANFKRIHLSRYEPSALGPLFVVRKGDNATLWVTPVLEEFKGALIWSSTEEDEPLKAIVLWGD